LPVLSVDMILGSLRQWRLLLVLLVTVLLFFVLSAALELRTLLLLVIVAALIPLFLPAVLVIQAWTHSTEQALRPTLCRAVARLLGADYLRLVGITGVLVLVIALTATRVPLLPVRLAIYLLCWFLLIVFIGNTVRARRADLAEATFFPTALDLTQSAEQLAAARERAADEIYAHWRSGAKHEAWRAAERYAMDASHPAEEWTWLLRRVELWDAQPLADKIRASLEKLVR
jgi:hypothetical protein